MRFSRPSKSKESTKAQFKHSKRRALERYNFELTETVYLQLCKRIATGKMGMSGLDFLFRDSNSRTAWAILHEDVWYAVIYDKERGKIATFLPPEVLVTRQPFEKLKERTYAEVMAEREGFTPETEDA